MISITLPISFRFLAALDTANGVGEVINLGSNYEISVGETAEMIFEIMSKESLFLLMNSVCVRKIVSDRLWADNTKALNLLNWCPQYGGREGFRRGLRETVDWFTNLKICLHTRQYTL